MDRKFKRGVILSLILFGLIIGALSAFVLYQARAESRHSQAQDAPVAVQTVAPAPSPGPTTVISPEPEDDVIDYLIVPDHTILPHKWGLDIVIDAWDDPVPGITIATGDQCDATRYDVCVALSAVAESEYAGYAQQHSTEYYEIVLTDDDNYDQTFTRQGVLCHELGHVLGLDHTDYFSCMNDDYGFTPWPAEQDLNLLNSPDWKPGVWEYHE